jgi:RNA polymerase-interacting CarD/CdnL/TRCF family regulator
MNSNTGFATGDFLVWPGEGMVRVEGRREMDRKSFVVMKAVESGTTMIIPIEKVASVVRSPVGRADAQRLVGVLRQQSGDSDNRTWAERYHDYMVTLIKRPLEAQVKALHTLYRTPYDLSFDERRLIYTYQRVVVGELAHALGKDLDAMLVELEKGQPAFAPNQPQRPDEPKVAEPKAPMPLNKHEYLGKISAPSGRIVVGEARAPATDTFMAQGKPGDWHAYVKEKGDDDDDAGALVLIHADGLGQYAKLSKTCAEITVLNVEGGTMAMISAEVRDDEKFQEATIFPVGPIVQGRGCMVSTGGDGGHRLRGAKIGDQFVALVVDF